ncbi:hypothetical protein F4778DRAFT_727476 [Xylariomycetidae sp. FL2044]|nr:hypothetical protein F4778DRAFT_727476 [Xylariomycetidae sp. FL2044]
MGANPTVNQTESYPHEPATFNRPASVYNSPQLIMPQPVKGILNKSMSMIHCNPQLLSNCSGHYKGASALRDFTFLPIQQLTTSFFPPPKPTNQPQQTKLTPAHDTRESHIHSSECVNISASCILAVDTTSRTCTTNRASVPTEGQSISEECRPYAFQSTPPGQENAHPYSTRSTARPALRKFSRRIAQRPLGRLPRCACSPVAQKGRRRWRPTPPTKNTFSGTPREQTWWRSISN